MVEVALIISCSIIVLFNIFLIFIYIKSKFKNYPYYFNVLFSLTISLNNILRLIHVNKTKKEESDVGCKIQAVLLTLSDKLIIALVCSYSLINFFGTCKVEFYRNNEKKIYIILVIISLLISIISTIIFVNQGYSTHSEYCYASTSNTVKKVVDSIITGILGLISLICLIVILINIMQLKNSMQNSDMPNRTSDIKYHICRFIFDICINITLFIYTLLLINPITKTNLNYWLIIFILKKILFDIYDIFI